MCNVQLMVDDSKEEIARRLQEAFARIGYEGRGAASGIGRLFGVSRETARKWLSGESRPETHRIAEISKRSGLDVNYLLGVSSAPESKTELIAGLLPTATPNSHKRLVAIQKLADSGSLSESDLAELERIAKHLASKAKG